MLSPFDDESAVILFFCGRIVVDYLPTSVEKQWPYIIIFLDLLVIVVDPDLVGSASFGQIRIRIHFNRM